MSEPQKDPAPTLDGYTSDYILRYGVKFPYRNHKGEERVRRVLPLHSWFGHTFYHQDEQWFFNAYDLDLPPDNNFRTFAMAGVLGPWEKLQ